MTFRFDHAVIVVRSLRSGIRSCAEAGLRALPGGRHVDAPTHNALVAFADGSYLELLAARSRAVPVLLALARATGGLPALLRRRAPLARRFLRHLAGRGGLVDFALSVSGMASAVERARRAGIAIEGPYSMSRERPDGRRISWQLGVPEDSRLPFLIEDTSPREARVPGGEATLHPLGATGVREVAITVSDLEVAGPIYASLLGAAGERGEGRIRFDLGGTALLLALSPGSPEGPTTVALSGIRGVVPARRLRELGVVAATPDHPDAPARWVTAVLAAGAGKRFGSPKQLALFDGEPLVRRAARAALHADLGPVLVIVGAAADRVGAAVRDLPVACVANQEWEEGMASSIRCAVRSARAHESIAGLIVTACDLPDLKAADLRSLAAALEATPDCWAAAADSGSVLGMPAAFRPTAFGMLASLTGDAGAREQLRRGEGVVGVPMASAARDVDTPES